MEKINVGIDLGTTNTLVCKIENAPQLIVMDQGSIGKDKYSLKSAVYFSNNDVLVGGEAYEKGSKAFKALKREIEDGRELIIKKSSRTLNPIDFSTMVLNEAMVKFEENADIDNDYQIENLVVTVPAEFNQRARVNTKEAIMNSNWMKKVKNVKLMDEPVAAALAHKELSHGKGTYLVYDLGGGTFDCSIIKGKQIGADNLIYDVLESSGDRKLGGVDFDKELGDYLYSNFSKSAEFDNLDPTKIGEIKNELPFLAEKVKIKLSFEDHVDDIFTYVFSDGTKHLLEIDINREQYWNVVKKLVDRTVHNTVAMINSCKIDIDGIVFVGGSTHDKQLREYVKEQTGITKEFFENPDWLVAQGAALSSAIHTSGGTYDAIKTTIIDRMEKSFGIVLHLGVIEWLVPAKVQLPIVLESDSVFSGVKPGQTSVDFDVIQGLNSELGIEDLTHNRWSIVGNISCDGFKNTGKVPRFTISVHIDEDKVATFEITQIDTGIKRQASVNFATELHDASTQEYRKQTIELMDEAKDFLKDKGVSPSEYDDYIKFLVKKMEAIDEENIAKKLFANIGICKKAITSNSNELKALAIYRAYSALE